MRGIPFLIFASFSLVCGFAPLPAFGQWMEDFSDGDITQGTLWQGDLTDFVVNGDLELQLMAPAAGQSQLFTYQPILDSARWTFYIRLDFSPSNTNQLGLILFADTADLASANGYYLEVGETGSADALRFFRLSAGQKTLLASGTSGAMGGTTAMVRGRMERDVTGNWQFFADYTGGFDLQPEFTVVDDAHLPGANAVFGPVCIYTSTRTDKFFFDDFAIEPLLPDVTPPALLQVDIIDSQEIKLLFSEPIQQSEAEDPDSYRLQPGNNPPSLAIWNTTLPAEVRLIWTDPFASMTTYTVKAFGLKDVDGNKADSLAGSFTYIFARPPMPGELLINEIMPDPNPPAGLPDAEFMELYNASGITLLLEGTRIATSSSDIALPPVILLPDSFLILCRPEHVGLFSPFGTTLGVTSLPTLPNEGTQLKLFSKDGALLQDIPYTTSWHATTAKRDGGWSLELVSPGQQCARTGNWANSIDPSGGTPGRRNSVYEVRVDSTGPRLQRVWPDSANRLILTFDEQLQSPGDVSWVSLSPSLPISAVLVRQSGYELEVELGSPLLSGTVYTLRPHSTLLDCVGNPYTSAQSFVVGLPEMPTPGDLLLNEILFNPPTGGSDFVELYNVSNKIFALQDMLLANLVPGKEETRPISIEALCFPGDHAVLTADTAFIRSWWPDADAKLLFQITMPAFLNDSGNVSLFYQEGPDQILLDRMDYKEDMHNTLLSDVQGVSLERLSPSESASDADNWQSAAEDVGFATPTQRNSQYLEITEGDGPFQLQDQTFSPDGDGVVDQLVIRYQFDEPGTILNLKVFDRQGRLVKDLANTQYLGREGLITWNGDTDEGRVAWIGAYIIWFETFNLNGKVKQYKKAVFLAQTLD
jgi:hypothetical protein